MSLESLPPCKESHFAELVSAVKAEEVFFQRLTEFWTEGGV